MKRFSVAALLVLTFAANAEEASDRQVPSLIYLQFLNQNAPTWLCQQDAVIQCLGLPVQPCFYGVQTAAEACGRKLLEQWPASFAESEENALKYSTLYRQCIFDDWVARDYFEQRDVDACTEAAN